MPWQPSHSQLHWEVMEPSGDLINLLIEGKENLVKVSEHKRVLTMTAVMWVSVWYVVE